MKFCGAAFALILASLPAGAEEAHCPQVRQAVASYGVSAAVAWARRSGYTDQQIAQARRCLAQPASRRER